MDIKRDDNMNTPNDSEVEISRDRSDKGLQHEHLPAREERRQSASSVLESVDTRRNVELGTELFSHVIRTTHQIGDKKAIVQTAIHTDDGRHTIGGMRIVTPSPGVSLENDVDGRLLEVGSLSSAMTYKCSLTGLPCGGQKTVALYEGGIDDLTTEERGDLLAQHIAEVVKVNSLVLFGPDMSVGEEVQNAILSHHAMLGHHIVGVSEAHGGLSIDKYGYTAQGVKAAIDFARDSGALQDGRRAVIAGFGAVGAHTAELLHNDDYPVVAISNRFGTIHNSGEALPIDSLFTVWNQWHEDVEKGMTPTALSADEAVVQKAKELGLLLKENDTIALLNYDAEILVLAARTKEIGASEELEELRKENPESVSIESVLKNTSLRVIAEGANAPLGGLAEEEAMARGVMILPDTAINGGGVKGCYEGWRYRTQQGANEAQQDPVQYRKEMFREIHEQVKTNLSEIHEQLQARGGTLREAMLLIAQRRSSVRK
jgi:glutamate dehydrogenase (NAD(P)+)